MIADLFDIKGSDIEGRGVFARKFIPKGTIIYFDCRKCKPWTKKELVGLSEKELRFIFTHDYPIKYCDERLLYNNHSCDSNTMGIGEEVSIVVRDIKKGEEQTEDYRMHCNGSLHFEYGCKCGAPNCMKRSTYVPPPSKELQKAWAKKIDTALKLVNKVDQPLKRELMKVHPELATLFVKNGKKRGEVIAELRKLRAAGPMELTDAQKKVWSQKDRLLKEPRVGLNHRRM